MEEIQRHRLKMPEERIMLLKAGWTDKEIEQLYLLLNDFTTLGNVLYTCS